MRSQNIILFEDEEILIANKPAGILSQPDQSKAATIVVELNRLHSYAFLAPVHRLDRNTSGALLLAKNSATAAKLTSQIKEKKIHRTYLALVKGALLTKGKIDFPLFKNEKENKSYVKANGKPAITHYSLIAKLPNTSLVKVQLETGRSHQIRAHFAHIKHPLIGDQKYGKKPWSNLFSRPTLHAYELEFSHPKNNKKMIIQAPIPEDLQDLLKKLSGGISLRLK